LFNNPVQYLDWAPNIWMGVSVENRRVIHWIHDLQAVPAYVRFVSYEPLLSPLDDLPLDGIH
jgi:protein gp37